jgi:hypothetical protein
MWVCPTAIESMETSTATTQATPATITSEVPRRCGSVLTPIAETASN